MDYRVDYRAIGVTVCAVLTGLSLLGCPAATPSVESETSMSAGTASAESGTGTSGEAPSAACSCFDAGPGSFDVTCEFTSTRCGSYFSTDCSDTGGPVEVDEESNAEVVACVQMLLESGGAGGFADENCLGGQFYDETRYFEVLEDGTAVDWTRSQDDLLISLSAVVHRQPPTAEQLAACAAMTDTEAHWSCLLDVLGGRPTIETCTKATSYNEF